MSGFDGMPVDDEPGRVITIQDQLAILRRRKWILLAVLLLVPAIAVAISSQKASRYAADAQVLLTYQSFAGLATSTPDQATPQDPIRAASTQAQLARVPTVLDLTLKAVPKAKLTRNGLRDASSVSAAVDNDILTFSVTDERPAIAVQLATAYARAYTKYRHSVDNSALQRARRDVQGRIVRLQTRGQGSTALAAKLAVTQAQLQTLETLQTSNATVVEAAGLADKVSPNPFRYGVIGAALGLILGLALVLLVDTLDTRVRSGEEVADRLRVPLLGRLPGDRKRTRGRHAVVMMSDTFGQQAEAFRTLRTNVELANLEQEAKVIAVASALPEEGKSTTLANLAVAISRSGQKVALVDLDLRRPTLAKFFESSVRWGVTDVALGHVNLDDALVSINVEAFIKDPDDLTGPGEQQLDVLFAGQPPPNPGEFMSGRRLARIIDQLRSQYDIVLIDTPPILKVGDALALSAHIDAFMLVVNLPRADRGELQELRRALGFARCDILGVVLTAAGEAGTYEYGNPYSGYVEGGAEIEPEPSPAGRAGRKLAARKAR